MERRFLVTGGAGFIGSNFIRLLLERDAEARVTNLDALTYAGVKATVEELDVNPRHHFAYGNINDPGLVASLVADADVVVHFAAESHVDRSITGPSAFVETNVLGTGVLLEAARACGIRFVHVSTDEVYGSVPTGFANEQAPLQPSSPYSASKAGSDLLALSYHTTFGLDVVVTRCTNNFGPYQFPEKLIPLFVTRLLEGGQVPLYGDGLNERDWLFVEDHCEALLMLVDQGESGQIYNIGAGEPVANLTITRALIELTGRDESAIKWVPDRPGHDRRYAVDTARIRALGWKPRHSLEESLAATMDWYRTRRDWWEPLRKGTGR
ncbi:MAG TPA: dTDP-glucose 4,6-dehydratase [Acidimicrobiia bacterium]|jgi:dTDP-glucose 4,6-dehydratase